MGASTSVVASLVRSTRLARPIRLWQGLHYLGAPRAPTRPLRGHSCLSPGASICLLRGVGEFERSGKWMDMSHMTVGQRYSLNLSLDTPSTRAAPLPHALLLAALAVLRQEMRKHGSKPG